MVLLRISLGVPLGVPFEITTDQLLLIYLMEFSQRFLSEVFQAFPGDFPGITPTVLLRIPTENCPGILGASFGISLMGDPEFLPRFFQN